MSLRPTSSRPLAGSAAAGHRAGRSLDQLRPALGQEFGLLPDRQAERPASPATSAPEEARDLEVQLRGEARVPCRVRIIEVRTGRAHPRALRKRAPQPESRPLRPGHGGG